MTVFGIFRQSDPYEPDAQVYLYSTLHGAENHIAQHYPDLGLQSPEKSTRTLKDGRVESGYGHFDPEFGFRVYIAECQILE